MNKIKEFFIRYWRDFVIVFGVVICSVTTILVVRAVTSKNVVSAVIYQQNEALLQIDLSKESDEVRQIKFPKEDVNIVIGVKKNAICILTSDCPHQDCVNMGWTSSSSQPIICAHYKVSIEITSALVNDVEIG